MGRTWKDKNKWDKKQEGKNIKKTKKEYGYASNEDYKHTKKFNRASSFEWYYDDDYEND
jgi:hypothetical protein